MFGQIQHADLDWQHIDGIDVPISKQFGDVYFSKDNGLLETRHVFLEGNNLSTRLAQLQDYEYFSVGETGFGTGLNILALWQLWQNVRPDNHSHLHAISVEKFPLTKADLTHALKAWPELATLSEQLIAQYPLAIAGCHRLTFPKERFSLDLWLGDAEDIFPIIPKTQSVNAWFLDGFAPACNPEMWQHNVLDHIVRLSAAGTTFASFSVAGVLKRGLKQHGIDISRPRGFGHKREMLKAFLPESPSDENSPPAMTQPSKKHIAVIGAGIAGLSTAWAFAQRGHQISIYDKNGALSGASGNPLALLNPKLCPAEQTPFHLMTNSWQYALRYYAQFKAYRPLHIEQFDLKQNGELLQLIQQYPDGLLQPAQQTDALPSLSGNVILTQAGAVIPQQLAEEILTHPNINIILTKIDSIKQQQQHYQLLAEHQSIAEADHVVLCCAGESHTLFENYPNLKPIRGQVSWLNKHTPSLNPHYALSYGGYCTQLNDHQFILGASFYPNRDDCDVLQEDHQHNFDLLHNIAPQYAQSLPEITQWHGRASIRAQSPDYFPLVGDLDSKCKIYTLAGLGSKGFLFAPLCSEILVAHVFGEVCPVPEQLMKQLSPRRFVKKVKIKKPYFKK
ncbi:MAG: FAD-dependent 5-carboxymethylaminomethyl-2-thiouridine(34) oxidoreductase MnmC [Acinetobacter sp.]